MATKKQQEVKPGHQFKPGDEVKECGAYAAKHRYSQKGQNSNFRFLGPGRYVVSRVEGAQVTVYHSVYRDYESKYELTVPSEQLLPFVSNKALEAEYKAVYERVSRDIEECLRIARSAIDEATSLAETHGVPFHGPSGLSQTYRPENLPDLDPVVIEEITGTYIDPDRSSGWEHSAIC